MASSSQCRGVGCSGRATHGTNCSPPARKPNRRSYQPWGHYPGTGNGARISCQLCSNGCKSFNGLQWMTPYRRATCKCPSWSSP